MMGDKKQNSNLIYPPPSIQPGMDYLPSTESSGSGDGRKSKSKSSVLYWILFSVILVIVLVVIMGVVMVYMVLSAELKASKSADATRPTLAAGSHVEPEEVTIELKEQSEIQKDAKKSIIRAATTMTERGNKIIFGTDLKSTGQRLKRQALITSGSNPAEGKLHPELLAARGRAEADTDRPKSECRRRVLPMCARTVPFNSTTYPNLIGDQNEFEARRSLPFFNLIARSNCNRRLKQLLCVLLEPPCHDGRALPPCKKFCRVALEGCAEHIPATLELSSVFDCRQYPDSTDPHTCVNLAIGRTCASDEYQCPDKSCIPRHWLCDGVRDCIFAADETNCTNAVNHYSQSACSTEEFQCDGKCVPTTWRCDGDRDCLDGSDEMNCSSKPGCGADRFKCHDGFGCIPKRWVCDGKAECRDGSDEQNCERQECSSGDYKCDNGICIPNSWVCDGQPDCKDASDERSCGPNGNHLNPQSIQNRASPPVQSQHQNPNPVFLQPGVADALDQPSQNSGLNNGFTNNIGAYMGHNNVYRWVH